MMLFEKRADGRPLRIGHRGAAAIAPENTLQAFRAATELGVDLIEFDVIALRRGPLVVAHSHRLSEVTHGAVAGRIGDLTLEGLREVAPALLTFSEALEFFLEEAPDIGLHVDLKLTTRLDELASEIVRCGLAERTVVSTHDVPSLAAISRAAPAITIGLTYPEDRLGLGHRGYLRPLARAGLAGMRAIAPARIGTLLPRTGARALMVQHMLATRRVVTRARSLGATVFAWTVDTRADLDRVLTAGVDGVISNDPGIFCAPEASQPLATLEA